MDELGRLYEEDETFMEKIRELDLGGDSYSDLEGIIKNTRKKMKSSDLLSFYKKEEAFLPAGEKKSPKDRKKNLDNPLEVYEELGILKREQSPGQDGKRSGDRRWELRSLSLKRLIRVGTRPMKTLNFIFRCFLIFFQILSAGRSRHFFAGSDEFRRKESVSF